MTAFGRNTAVRVRFSEETPVAWHPASIPGSGHVVGVDAGCVVIADYVGYSSMTRREKAAAFERFTVTAPPATLELSLGGVDVGLAADSGYGDGSYPGTGVKTRTARWHSSSSTSWCSLPRTTTG
ncbi:hypothetical protein NKG05_07390 [Oerskovia sp. M15]